MTQEEKAKRYDEAVINGSRLWECGEITRENYEYIFPELAESEDERIRKELIKEINGLWENDSATWPSSLEKKNKYIAWLEKQGKQKDSVVDFKAKDWYVSKVDGKIRNIYHSVDKVEPKFKVGDWVVTPKNQVYQITSIEGTSYRFNNESTYWEICYCDEQCHIKE